jgi:hypothetical protein
LALIGIERNFHKRAFSEASAVIVTGEAAPLP